MSLIYGLKSALATNEIHQKRALSAQMTTRCLAVAVTSEGYEALTLRAK